MLATLERIELLENAEELARMILESDIAENYRFCLNKMTNNRGTQEKIRRFVGLKELYEEVQRFGKYHPDYKRVMVEIREAKREMDLDPHVADYKIAENDLQGLLDEVSMLIGGSVSKHIKVPSGNPFFETSHGSGCGGGGSCSCSK